MIRKPPIETFPQRISIGDKYDPAMLITEQAEADHYFEKLVAHSMRYFGKTRQQAEELERINLGYYAGYYDRETRARVEKLFNCAHPVFGAIAEKGPPDPKDAIMAGMLAGGEMVRDENKRLRRTVATLKSMLAMKGKS